MRQFEEVRDSLLAAGLPCAAAARTAAAQDPAPRPPAVGRRSREAGARAEPRDPGRAFQPADRGHDDRAGAQLWLPTLSSTLQGVKQDNPATSALAGGQTTITDNRFTTQVGMSQILPFGTSYSLAWNSARSTTTNIFTNYNPLLNSYVAFNLTQPLLRNRTIDQYRQQLQITHKQREASDVSLQRDGRSRPCAT